MKLKAAVLVLAVALPACHRDQGTTSTTSTATNQSIHSIQYYMDHKTERRARNDVCKTYATKDVLLYDKDCQNAHSAGLGVGDF